MQRNGLADAATSQNADRLARQHVEADVIEHYIVAEGFGDITKFDVGSGHRKRALIASPYGPLNLIKFPGRCSGVRFGSRFEVLRLTGIGAGFFLELPIEERPK